MAAGYARVEPSVRSHADHEGVIGGGDIEVHGAKGHASQRQADVHIGELGCTPKRTGWRPGPRARRLGSWKQLVRDVGSRQYPAHRDEAVALLASLAGSRGMTLGTWHTAGKCEGKNLYSALQGNRLVFCTYW